MLIRVLFCRIISNITNKSINNLIISVVTILERIKIVIKVNVKIRIKIIPVQIGVMQKPRCSYNIVLLCNRVGNGDIKR